MKKYIKIIWISLFLVTVTPFAFKYYFWESYNYVYWFSLYDGIMEWLLKIFFFENYNDFLWNILYFFIMFLIWNWILYLLIKIWIFSFIFFFINKRYKINFFKIFVYLFVLLQIVGLLFYIFGKYESTLIKWIIEIKNIKIIEKFQWIKMNNQIFKTIKKVNNFPTIDEFKNECNKDLNEYEKNIPNFDSKYKVCNVWEKYKIKNWIIKFNDDRIGISFVIKNYIIIKIFYWDLYDKSYKYLSDIL